MKKFDKIYKLGKHEGNTFHPEELVYVEEKVDGANFRVWRDETGLRFGSRTIEFLPDGHPDQGFGNFTNAVEFIKSLDTSKFVEGYIYFFEAMHKHTINYDWETTPKVVLFDVYDIEADYYEHRLNFDAYVPEELIIPCIFEGKYADFDGVIPQSKYYNGLAEGYVIKPSLAPMNVRDRFGNRHIAKVVGDKFKEEHNESFGLTGDKEVNFVNTYCTHGRIEKHIQKFQDNGNKFELKMISALVFNIMQDICNEEFKKMLKMKVVDFKIIRKEISIKVKSYLTFKGDL